tara:strand:+ start:284 stop:718 length:435 start_codon:yes stop_codon:yes gene_type:complete
MAKTNRLAEPRSISKRGQRRDIYSDENGNVFGDTGISERNFATTTERINNSDLAARQTMRHYFDDEWFDEDCATGFGVRLNNTKSVYKKSSSSRGSAITPMRCDECKRPYQKVISNSPTKPNFAYINKEVFANMPLERGICGNC